MDAKDEVKQRLAIEDVISEYVQLKRAGRNFKGLSPFTSEKTPSFVVSPDKQIWHDFSSGRGGDVFSFVMEVEGLDFRGALEHLARRAGVDLEQFKPAGGRRGPAKQRLEAVNEAAARFYQLQFSKNRAALEYVFKKRGFTKETALDWRLGYSPNTGRALLDYLKGKGFDEKEIQAAGLTAQRARGLGDMFRGRLMIPLQDPQGAVIGFTARLLVDEPRAPKYINTPATALYDKSRHVYGLHQAKQAIRSSGFSVIAEGNLDVISSHQAGVKEVVATAGTALTEYQLKALSRLAGDVRLAFDADRAGLAATERAVPIASKVKISLSVISIPEGKDPDELIKKDPELWRQAIEEKQYALDWLMDHYATQLDLKTAEGKRHYSDILLPVVRSLDDPVERDHYMTAIADRAEVGRAALEQKLASGNSGVGQAPRRRAVKPPAPETGDVKAQRERRRLADRRLSLALLQPSQREALSALPEAAWPSDESRQLAAFLMANPAWAGQAEAAKELTSIADYVKIQTLLYEELYQGLEATELANEADRLTARLIEEYVKTEKQKLALEFAGADEQAAQALLVKAKELDKLLSLNQ